MDEAGERDGVVVVVLLRRAVWMRHVLHASDRCFVWLFVIRDCMSMWRLLGMGGAGTAVCEWTLGKAATPLESKPSPRGFRRWG